MAEIRVATKLLPMPRTPANVYRLKQPAVSERSIRGIARLLGMKAEQRMGRITSDVNKVMYSEQHLELTVYRASGGIRLIDRSRWQVDDRKADIQIDDATARKLATRAIRVKKLGAQREMRFLKASRLRVGEATKDGKHVSERTIDVGVAMQRMVDRIPVDGPGGKVIVYLDHQHHITGVERIWRQISGIHRRRQQHREPQLAIDEMAAHFADKQGIIEVQEVRYGYFEDDWQSTQKYLQPAYVIFGLTGLPDSNVRKRTIYVASALKRPMGHITPPLSKRQPQRRRQ